MSIFSTSCDRCGSKEHATSDCPHGLFDSKCEKCGSKDHATRDCPHGFFDNSCDRCGSKEHATRNCPHGFFDSKCDKCGSTDHSTSNCPHGFFDTKCDRCGSKNHRTSDCPQSFFRTTSTNVDESNDTGCLAYLIMIVVVLGAIAAMVYLAVWLMAFVVAPIVMLNLTTILLLGALIYKKHQTPLLVVSILGVVYLLLDIHYGWLSVLFYREVWSDPIWIDIVVLMNSLALVGSIFILVKAVFSEKLKAENTAYKQAGVVAVSLLLATGVNLVYQFGLKSPAPKHTRTNTAPPVVQRPTVNKGDGGVVVKKMDIDDMYAWDLPPNKVQFKKGSTYAIVNDVFGDGVVKRYDLYVLSGQTLIVKEANAPFQARLIISSGGDIVPTDVANEVHFKIPRSTNYSLLITGKELKTFKIEIPPKQ